MAAYKMIDVACIYPITPSSTIAELIDQYAAQKKLNAFGNIVQVHQAHSELGASAGVHGASASGSLASTFTSSQGLLLMIPNLYFLAAQNLPAVIHLANRSVGTMSTTLSPDHSDIYAVSNTGCSAVCSRSTQECHDIALAAHISAVSSMSPMIHFFEGFRVSHQFESFNPIPDSVFVEAVEMVNDRIVDWRNHNIINPANPDAHGLGIGNEIYYQLIEAHSSHFNAISANVEKSFDFIFEKTGRRYHCFEYFGHKQAEDVIIIMGCSALNAQNVASKLAEQGKKVGVINVRLWRPFDPKLLVKALPSSVKRIAVMDRNRDLSSCGELLYKEVMSALFKENVIKQLENVINISYGLAGVELTPGQILSVYDRLATDKQIKTLRLGIIDDIHPETNLLPISVPTDLVLLPPKTKECVVYAIGSDGTIGAIRNAMKLLQDALPDSYCQANFEFDGKKSGGLTISYLRFGPTTCLSQYNCEQADFVACHTQAYVGRYDFLAGAKQNATFVLNCDYVDDIENRLPGSLKRQIAQKNITFIPVDCNNFARQCGLGNKISLATVMFLLRFGMEGLLNFEKAAQDMKALAKQTYAKATAEVMAANMKIVDLVVEFIQQNQKFSYDRNIWQNAPIEQMPERNIPDSMKMPFMQKMDKRQFDQITTSEVLHAIGGGFPSGLARYEKPGTASDVPCWTGKDCIQCNLCSAGCPHGSIRPTLVESCPFESIPIKDQSVKKFRIQVSPADCKGCAICVQTCPKKCLEMQPIETQMQQQELFDQALDEIVPMVDVGKANIKDLQNAFPYFLSPGSCPGCPETVITRMLTTLFGDHLVISSAVGCCLVWGHYNYLRPYMPDRSGRGPAAGTSAFEDNALFGLGMHLSDVTNRDNLRNFVVKNMDKLSGAVKTEFENFVEKFNDAKFTIAFEQNIQKLISQIQDVQFRRYIDEHRMFLAKRTHWIIGGDGWSFDIDFGGVDHVMASGLNVKILIFNNNCYANTGGQRSKATPAGAQTKNSYAGCDTQAKNTSLMFATYRNSYVAQVAFGANRVQALTAIREAEAYQGPACVICYCPCISHLVKGGLTNSEKQQKLAVETGIWPLFRASDGKITQDSKITKSVEEFVINEQRFSALDKFDPVRSQKLREHLVKDIEFTNDFINKLADKK